MRETEEGEIRVRETEERERERSKTNREESQKAGQEMQRNERKRGVRKRHTPFILAKLNRLEIVHSR